jgi:hypothetical protein
LEFWHTDIATIKPVTIYGGAVGVDESRKRDAGVRLATAWNRRPEYILQKVTSQRQRTAIRQLRKDEADSLSHDGIETQVGIVEPFCDGHGYTKP